MMVIVSQLGAPYNDGAGRNAGHARVYEWDYTWLQLASDLDGEFSEDKFSQGLLDQSSHLNDGTAQWIPEPASSV